MISASPKYRSWPLSSKKYNSKLSRRYNLLDDKVKFVKGWFRDTLHVAPIRGSVLRMDGEL